VAVQVAPVLKPVTVVVKGVASEAEPEAGDGVPLVQVTLTDTEAALFGMKSLLTVSVVVFSVLVIVQLPLPVSGEKGSRSPSVHVPDEL
jgi:hypothetical protein